ncbi:MAG: hypothetical protein AAB788_01810 [Patescibacteria group bacterium]
MIGEEGQLPTPGKPVVLQPKEATSAIKKLLGEGKFHNYDVFQADTENLPPETPMADILKIFEGKKKTSKKPK